jgi:hypothetical protein
LRTVRVTTAARPSLPAFVWRVRKLIWWRRGSSEITDRSSFGSTPSTIRHLRLGVLEILSLLIAAGLAPLFYWRLLTTNPEDAATLPSGDFTDLNYPYRRWVAEQLARGVEPYWNQFVSAGHSAVGDIQFRIFYPPENWLASLGGSNFSVRLFEIGVVGHIAFAVVVTYLLARRLSQSRVGGLVSAVVFGFGGYLSGFPVQQTNVLEASVWLPFALLCVELGTDYGSPAGFAAGAGALGLSALAGHPQTFLYALIATICYALYKSWCHGHIRLTPLLGTILIGLGSVALAAIALLPAYLHLALTDRATAAYDFTKGGFALHEIVGILFPSSIGGAPLYNGIFTWFLVAIALVSPFRRSNKVFWCVLAVMALLLSFGANTFLQPVFYLVTDSYKLHDHERAVFLFDFGVAILAGYGAAQLAASADVSLAWLHRALRWPTAAIVAFFVLFVVDFASTTGAQGTLLAFADPMVFLTLVFSLSVAILWLRERGLISPAMTGLLVIGLVTLDIFSVDWQANLRPGPPDQLLAPTPIVDYLEQYPTGLFRIASEGLLPGDGNAGALWRLEDVVGNSPLETKSYSDFTKLVPEWTRWQVLNVRFVVTKRKLDDPRLQLVRNDGDVNLYEIDQKDRLPRAYVVDQFVAAPSHQIALQAVQSVNLHTTAIVEGTLPDWLIASQPMTTTINSSIHLVQFSDYQANTVTVKADLAQSGLLVLSNVDYPGWHASVDGTSTPIFEVNGIVQGVALKAGLHTVQFTFNPPGLIEGQAITNLARTLLLGIAGLEILARIVLGLEKFRRLGRHRPSYHHQPNESTELNNLTTDPFP